MTGLQTKFESGPIVKILAGIGIGAIVALGIYALATGNALAVGLLITLVAAGLVGVVLETG